MPLHDKLQELKKKCRMSNREISLKSGVPESTVCRILSGATDEPQHSTLYKIVTAMGGSMDELEKADLPGKTLPDENQMENPCSNPHDSCTASAEEKSNALKQMYEQRIVELKEQTSDLKQLNDKLRSNVSALSHQNVSYRRRFIITLLVAACAITFIFALFFFDFMHPGRGWVIR